VIDPATKKTMRTIQLGAANQGPRGTATTLTGPAPNRSRSTPRQVYAYVALQCQRDAVVLFASPRPFDLSGRRRARSVMGMMTVCASIRPGFVFVLPRSRKCSYRRQ